ncbi:DUF1707 domain-containing protein [Nocardiopsis halotolerans]|uniref:DUF1707 domain-containing protein n=1 Tax=Nocardiopsis halotolerans TaxID=124252 RepID=UPI00034D0100|nr:DUF1707 domain-containing protein [Nocardiopsis halotolerans]
MSDPVPSMRTSDAERDRVAQLLQEHFAQGRLDHEEFTDRLSRVYRSRTVNELATVTNDLPERDLADFRNPSQEPAVAPPITIRDPALMVPWMLYAGVNVLCFVIWLILFLTTDYDYPWFLWVLGPWGIVMGIVTVGVLLPQRNASDGDEPR